VRFGGEQLTTVSQISISHSALIVQDVKAVTIFPSLPMFRKLEDLKSAGGPGPENVSRLLDADLSPLSVMSSQKSIPMFDAQAERAEIGESLLAAVTRVVESGAFILGPIVKELEQHLGGYVGTKLPVPVHCIGVASGTAALHLALLALNIGLGDEVITVPFTWISSAEVVPLVGAKVVFADIDEETYCMSPETLRPVLTKLTRAVIVVSLFGFVPDYKKLRDTMHEAEKQFGKSIALIEDGAQSFGAIGMDGFMSCGSPYTTLATTSFFPSKPLGSYGDGGALFTTNPALSARISSLRSHGKDAASGLHTSIGLNGRLDAIQAAVVLAKMSHVDDMLARRRAVAELYTQLLVADGRVITPSGAGHVYGVYAVRVLQRDAVALRLRGNGIACGTYYDVCVHEQPVFRLREEEGGAVVAPVAERMGRQTLALPIHPYMPLEDVGRVVAEISAALTALNVTSKPE
jgi:UDP-2-acetamido-2-deoxy-ribo-hexuluronate aminotransferase